MTTPNYVYKFSMCEKHLRDAERAYGAAKVYPTDEEGYDAVCFWAHLSAEDAAKAVFYKLNPEVDTLNTHDISFILKQCKLDTTKPLEAYIKSAASKMKNFSVQGRYGDPVRERINMFSQLDATHAIEYANAFRDWAAITLDIPENCTAENDKNI